MTVDELAVYLDRLHKEGLGSMDIKYQTYDGEVLDIDDVTVGSYCVKISE